MLQEFVQEIYKNSQELADAKVKASQAVKFIELPNSPLKRLQQFGEKLEVIDVPPPARNHRCTDVQSFIEAIQLYSSDKKGVVWIGSKSIVYIIDDVSRLDRITLRLKPSEQYQKLTTITPDGGLTIDQRSIINLFRVMFFGCVNGTLVQAFRKVAAKSGANVNSEINHGKDRIGRDVEQEMLNAADIPDVIEVTYQVFENITNETLERANLPLDMTAGNGEPRFTLRTIPGQLEQNKLNALALIHDILSTKLGKEFPIFVGECEPKTSSDNCD